MAIRPPPIREPIFVGARRAAPSFSGRAAGGKGGGRKWRYAVLAAVGAERGGGEAPVSLGGGPPQIKTSGHRSAPLGHTTVPASTRAARKSAVLCPS
jgi:hypothetical protein